MTCRIVAEVSANHLGSMARALAIVAAAARAGAWGVKFQTYTPNQMVSRETEITEGPWKGRNALGLYCEAHTPREWHAELFARARGLGLTPFSSVFHPDDVDFLEKMDCPIYKISSFELTDLDLIRHAARTGKPLVMSTGMATVDEISLAVLATRTPYERMTHLTLLKCTSAYPASPADANLATMVHMFKNWPVEVGLSDHTKGIGVAVAAAALGATMIEKHLTLRRDDGGPDAEFSMEPEEFRQLVTECRRASMAVGEVRYGPTESEAPSLRLRRQPGGMRGVIG